MELDKIKEEVNKEENKKPPYKSQDGFVRVPLIRGFGEIKALYYLIGQHAFICGGYARYCASPTVEPIPAKDIDVYCKDEGVFEMLKNALMKEFSLEIKHENDVSITFKRAKEGPFKFYLPIQLIKPMEMARIVTNGELEKILSNFDFTIIRAAILDADTVLVDADFMHDEESKILRLKNIHCPVSSTLRCMKYSRKGYWLKPIECLKLFNDWERRGAEYRTKLVDFITQANGGEGLSKEDVEELERMMMID